MLVETGQREAEDCVDLPLYILTNNRCINGAAYLAYDDVISDFAHQINSSLFILPSSIHELLLLPAPDDGDKGYLNEMVQDINKFVVSDFDYLSDCVYYYDIKNGCIRI
jgi:hypothetical protein